MHNKSQALEIVIFTPPVKLSSWETWCGGKLDGAIHQHSNLPGTFFPIEMLEKLNLELEDLDLNLTLPARWTETVIAVFFNSISKKLAKKQGKPLHWHWVISQHNQPPNGSSLKPKPDLVLVDKDQLTVPEWGSIYAVVETTSLAKSAKIWVTICQKAFTIFEMQCNWWFVPSIAFTGDCIWFYLHDHTGEMNEEQRIQKGKRLKKWMKRLVWFLTGLMLSEKMDQGYDQLMVWDNEGHIVEIMVQRLEYNIVEQLFKSHMLRGHATQCWHVWWEGKDYIIKDSWIDTTGQWSKLDILKALKVFQHWLMERMFIYLMEKMTLP